MLPLCKKRWITKYIYLLYRKEKLENNEIGHLWDGVLGVESVRKK